jgi:hypothetical protein
MDNHGNMISPKRKKESSYNHLREVEAYELPDK